MKRLFLSTTLWLVPLAAFAQQAQPGALPAGAATAANQARFVSYSEAQGASVAANASAFGVGVPRAVPTNFDKYNVAVVSTQTGTLNVQACQDSACNNKITYAPVSVAANTMTTLQLTIVAPYYQSYFTNGGTAATLTYYDSFTAN